MRRVTAIEVLLLLALAACAAVPHDSVVPGSIGVAVEARDQGVRVKEVGAGGPGAAAGLRAGDIVLRYAGEAVEDVRQFNRLVVDSQPGSVVRVQVLRGGAVQDMEVVVEQLDTTWRG